MFCQRILGEFIMNNKEKRASKEALFYITSNLIMQGFQKLYLNLLFYHPHE